MALHQGQLWKNGEEVQNGPDDAEGGRLGDRRVFVSVSRELFLVKGSGGSCLAHSVASKGKHDVVGGYCCFSCLRAHGELHKALPEGILVDKLKAPPQ